MEEGRIRVIAPDVGGGFGYKGVLLAEEVCAGFLAMRLRRPIRWIEDRREHLTGGANCREHHYDITGYAAADGTLLGAGVRGDRRFRRLLRLPVLRLPGSGAGRQHPAGAVPDGGIPLPHLVPCVPTSRRSCPTAAWPAPGCASRWNP